MERGGSIKLQKMEILSKVPQNCTSLSCSKCRSVLIIGYRSCGLLMISIGSSPEKSILVDPLILHTGHFLIT